MIVYLDSDNQIEIINNILVSFGPHTENELIHYFRVVDRKKAKKSMLSLTNNKHIIKNVVNNETYYSIVKRTANEQREKYAVALKFIRTLIDAKVEGDVRLCKNQVHCISAASFPCTLYFYCNNTLYDLYYIPRSKVDLICEVVRREDMDLKKDKEYINPNRIILTDSPDYFKDINISNVVFKVCLDEQDKMIIER